MYRFICNPTAGNGYAKEAAESAFQKLKHNGIECEIVYSTCGKDATRLAQVAVEDRVDTVIACGGDGTIANVADGLKGSKTALGILPCGTGNDFIKTAGISKNWEEALDIILQHPARPVDCGTVNGRLFMNIVGTGFDVMVLDYAETAKKKCKGIWPYLYGVIRSIAAYKPFHMHIEIDDLKLDGDYMIFATGNGRCFGGGIPITPMASLDDGLLEVVVVRSVPNWKIPFYLPALMKGTLYKKKPATHYQAKKCKVSYEGMRVNLDGEILSMDSAEIILNSNQLLLHW